MGQGAMAGGRRKLAKCRPSLTLGEKTSVLLVILTFALVCFFPASVGADYLDGDTVRGVQTALNQTGYQAGAVDGQYGPLTASAIQAYQKEHKLPESGTIDDSLLTSLGILPGGKPDPRLNRKKLRYDSDHFHEAAFGGVWYPLGDGISVTGYEICLPGNWEEADIRRSENEILYQTESAEGFAFDMAYFTLLPKGDQARVAIRQIWATAGLYDFSDLCNTLVYDCWVGSFQGLALEAIEEEEGAAQDLTWTFAGMDDHGQVLVAGISAISHQPQVRYRLKQILCSLRETHRYVRRYDLKKHYGAAE